MPGLELRPRLDGGILDLLEGLSGSYPHRRLIGLLRVVLE